MPHKKLNQKGFSHLLVVGAVAITALVGFIGWRTYTLSQRSANKATPVITPIKSSPSTESPTTQATPSPVPTSSTPKPSPKKTSTPTQKLTTSIQIKGTQACQTSTQAALNLLKEKAPAHYAIVTTYIGIIECVSQGSGMYAYEVPPRYVVGDATRNAGTVWYAGTIAHDAGHSKLYHDYLTAHPGQSVPNDVWTGENAERSCLEAQHDALSKIGGTQSQLDYVQNIINSQYYNIPYDQRWW